MLVANTLRITNILPETNLTVPLRQISFVLNVILVYKVKFTFKSG